MPPHGGPDTTARRNAITVTTIVGVSRTRRRPRATFRPRCTPMKCVTTTHTGATPTRTCPCTAAITHTERQADVRRASQQCRCKCIHVQWGSSNSHVYHTVTCAGLHHDRHTTTQRSALICSHDHLPPTLVHTPLCTRATRRHHTHHNHTTHRSFNPDNPMRTAPFHIDTAAVTYSLCIPRHMHPYAAWNDMPYRPTRAECPRVRPHDSDDDPIDRPWL